MALHWNAEDIENWEEINEGSDWNITQSLIFATMVIGINKITTENATEVFVRLKMTEAFIGKPFTSYDENGERTEHGWTLEMIERRIGLGTNASTMTKQKFNASVSRRLREDAEKQARREAKQAA